ncbi:drug/metabolite transporter (DMT)-like permease [Kitasatospora sp. MAP12-15]|uniref:DMT family transporter n=1 Tax=unclassified Kitasatospora TaxID=2633591 RepID=UPI0024732516|nr:DMT family transporter [Kitasatospora sp. MAP12-44]MDH6115009.1 drug/metabolite transporter (DMT)-like permease [Kitasatospora sp. MAP12-44]
MHTPAAVLFALLTTASNALATVLQRKAARRVPAADGLRWSLITRLVHQRVWLAGIAATGAAACFQALALANGALSVVQPVFVLELPIALLLAGVILRRRLSAEVWRATGCITVGLGVALWAASPTAGHGSAVPAGRWVLVLVCCLGAAAFLTATAAARPPGAVRAACLALAAAIGYALTAALLKTSALRWEADGIRGFFTAWQTYGFAAVGVASLFLLQNALQSGSLVFSQPALTLGDAGTSVALGAVLYGERIRGGWWAAVELAGSALILLGLVLLSRSPLAHELTAPEPEPEPARH